MRCDRSQPFSRASLAAGQARRHRDGSLSACWQITVRLTACQSAARNHLGSCFQLSAFSISAFETTYSRQTKSPVRHPSSSRKTQPPARRQFPWITCLLRTPCNQGRQRWTLLCFNQALQGVFQVLVENWGSAPLKYARAIFRLRAGWRSASFFAFDRPLRLRRVVGFHARAPLFKGVKAVVCVSFSSSDEAVSLLHKLFSVMKCEDAALRNRGRRVKTGWLNFGRIPILVPVLVPVAFLNLRKPLLLQQLGAGGGGRNCSNSAHISMYFLMFPLGIKPYPP